jgi:hypothetical protein
VAESEIDQSKLSDDVIGTEIAFPVGPSSRFVFKPGDVFFLSPGWRPTMARQPTGDVFAEMQGCVDQGISGRPSLARFVEVTYEAILVLKRQIDELRARRPRFGLKRKRGRSGPKSDPKKSEES